EALRKVADFPPHLVLLDLMMPDHDGWETFDALRKVTTAPVIVVSARDNKDDIVKGLSLGIDDYLTKPFFNAEVVARVKTVLRRARTSTTMQLMAFPDVSLTIDTDDQEVSLKGNLLHLTPREYAVLLVLARRAPRGVSNQVIAREVWGEDSFGARKRIKYLVYLLRKKIESEPSQPKLILNHEAYGYRLQATPMEVK
ncbi:MAG: response regulator transcription factor, partial [Anaerolineaceae bacterium]|nr:response regulator transcription factor [Anaerolineaceae bacterium]